MKVAPIEIKEVGIVKEVRKGIVKISGMGSCICGGILQFKSGIKGMIIGFNDTEVMALVLGEETEIHLGDKVWTEAEVLKIGVGDGLIGKIVNSLGVVAEGQEKVDCKEYHPIFREAAGVMDRVPIHRQLQTGIKILDMVIPIGKGQRELIIGDRVTGKSTIALDTIINQRDKGVICIYCWVGGGNAGFSRIISSLKERDAFDYTLVVASPASASPAEQYLAPYTAATIGEYFMYKGRDVFVVFDDLTKHAWIWRELSLLMKRSPGREAYPGDIFYLHSQLMERAANLSPENGGGSMTFFPIVETQQGDVTGYIPSNLVSMTDGQVYLSSNLFREGFRPAIDLTLSVSRIGSKVQPDALKEVSSRLRLEYSQYNELLRLTRLKTRVSSEFSEKLKRGQTLCDLLRQGAHQSASFEEEVIIFYAFKRNILEILPEETLKKFMQGIYPFLLVHIPQVLKQIRQEKTLSSSIKEQLDKAFIEFFKQEKII